MARAVRRRCDRARQRAALLPRRGQPAAQRLAPLRGGRDLHLHGDGAARAQPVQGAPRAVRRRDDELVPRPRARRHAAPRLRHRRARAPAARRRRRGPVDHRERR
eukprot:5265385-Prymnesium_polylepis.1